MKKENSRSQLHFIKTLVSLFILGKYYLSKELARHDCGRLRTSINMKFCEWLVAERLKYYHVTLLKTNEVQVKAN